MQYIIPSIIPESLDELRNKLALVRGACVRVQLDVMDGTYAPACTWPYQRGDSDSFVGITHEDEGLPYWQNFDYEVDLLLREPEKQLEAWAVAGAASVIVHIGTSEKLSDIFSFSEERRIEVALAIKPGDDTAGLEPWVDQVTFVQVMGNEKVGFHGKPLDPRAIELIRTLHERYPALTIGVDIGVTVDTLPSLVDAGASRFAVGSALWNNIEPKRVLKDLSEIAEEQALHA